MTRLPLQDDRALPPDVPGGYWAVEATPQQVEEGVAGLVELLHAGGVRTVIFKARTPNGLVANLARHEVEVHADGSISVSPSILVNRPPEASYHGWLRRGVWTEA